MPKLDRRIFIFAIVAALAAQIYNTYTSYVIGTIYPIDAVVTNFLVLFASTFILATIFNALNFELFGTLGTGILIGLIAFSIRGVYWLKEAFIPQYFGYSIQQALIDFSTGAPLGFLVSVAIIATAYYYTMR